MILMQDIKKMMNKKNPLVSILINNYNKENFCAKAVRSIIDQDYKNLEIIFYDDNSSDTSVDKIKELKKKLNIKKLKIIENKIRENIFSYNQIEGIRRSLSRSNGEIICILDSDDLFKKNKIKKIVEQFKKNKFFEILFDVPIYYYNNKNQKKINKNYKIRANKWPSFPPTSCISFQRKSLVNAIKKINIKKNEELWFDFRIATYFAIKKKQFNLINNGLTCYRQDDFSFDKNYKKYINRKWWKRREEAFNFLFALKKDLYNKNLFTFDFLITKIINKIYSFF
jgi:glycosyltransferase involved in cell wall biosynthesis